MPSAPSQRVSGASFVSTFATCLAFMSAYDCTPVRPVTKSPTASAGSFDAAMRPPPNARMTSLSFTGATYDF